MKSILIRLSILITILSLPTYFIYKDYLSIQLGSLVPKLNGPKEVRVVPVDDEKIVLRGTMPDLNKSWSIPGSFNAEAKRILDLKISDANKALKLDSNQYDKWVDLGTFRKVIGDYKEAEAIWVFASRNWPDSLVAYHNLGDLYASYLRDYQKAEENMQKVIEIDPRYVSEYRSLLELYKSLYGSQDRRAIDVLVKGLAKNPQSVDLMILLATNYKEGNDSINARKYYEMALRQAKELSNLPLQKSIEAELSNISN